MKATESATIYDLYGDKRTPAEQEAIQRNLDVLHVQYAKQAEQEVLHSLKTKGMAKGTCNYEHPASCAIMETLVFSEAVAVNNLVDLAAAWATPGTTDAELGALCRRMFQGAVTLVAEELADGCDEGVVAKWFHEGKGDE